MAFHLLLGSASPNWRLHVTESPADVQERLLNAEVAEQVPVDVVMNDRLEPQRIWVNPRAVGWWTIAELPDPS